MIRGDTTQHSHRLAATQPVCPILAYPPLPAIQTRCFADHLRAWRCEAGADVRRARRVASSPANSVEFDPRDDNSGSYVQRFCSEATARSQSRIWLHLVDNSHSVQAGSGPLPRHVARRGLPREYEITARKGGSVLHVYATPPGPGHAEGGRARRRSKLLLFDTVRSPTHPPRLTGVLRRHSASKACSRYVTGAQSRTLVIAVHRN